MADASVTVIAYKLAHTCTRCGYEWEATYRAGGVVDPHCVNCGAQGLHRVGREQREVITSKLLHK